MVKNKKVENFDLSKANRLSARLKVKIKELEESVAVIDELADAKELYLQLNSTNTALERNIEKNKVCLADKEAEVRKILDKMVNEKARSEKDVERAKTSNAEKIKAADAETRAKIDSLGKTVKEAEVNAREKIKIAEKSIKDAEQKEAEALAKKEQAEATYNNLKQTLFA